MGSGSLVLGTKLTPIMADDGTVDSCDGHYIGDRTPLDTGFGRIKSLFWRSNGELYLSNRAQMVPQAIFFGSLLGFLIGGRFGSRIAVKAHILNNQLTKYPSTVQARRELHSASFLAFMKSGSMWGWRSAVLSGLYSFIQTIFKEYRDKDDGLNYMSAGVCTGIGYKLFSGPRELVVGVVVGGLLSAPVALVVQTATWLLPKDSIKIENKKKRLQMIEEYYYWEERERRTDSIIEELEQSIALTSIEADIQDKPLAE